MKKTLLLTLAGLAAAAVPAGAATDNPATINGKVYNVGYLMPPATFYSKIIDWTTYKLQGGTFAQLEVGTPNVLTNASVVMDLSNRAVSAWDGEGGPLDWYVTVDGEQVTLGEGSTLDFYGEPGLFSSSQALPTLEIATQAYTAPGNGCYFGGRTPVAIPKDKQDQYGAVSVLNNGSGTATPNSALFANLTSDATADQWQQVYPENENMKIIGAANVIGAPAGSYVLRSVTALLPSVAWNTTAGTPVTITAKVYAYDEETGELGKVLATGCDTINKIDGAMPATSNPIERGISCVFNAPLTVTGAVVVALEIPDDGTVTSISFSADQYTWMPDQYETTGGLVQGNPEQIVKNDLVPNHAAAIAHVFDASGNERTVLMRVTEDMVTDRQTLVGNVTMMFGTEIPYLFAQYDWNAETTLHLGETVNVVLNDETPTNDYRVACPVIAPDNEKLNEYVTVEGAPEWLKVTLTLPIEKEVEQLREEMGNPDGEARYFNAQFALGKNAPAKPEATVTLSYLGCSQKYVISATPTGIDGIEADGEGAAAIKGIFDLQGRRLDKADAPGLYIIDGKKVVVK